MAPSLLSPPPCHYYYYTCSGNQSCGPHLHHPLPSPAPACYVLYLRCIPLLSLCVASSPPTTTCHSPPRTAIITCYYPSFCSSRSRRIRAVSRRHSFHLAPPLCLVPRLVLRVVPPSPPGPSIITAPQILFARQQVPTTGHRRLTHRRSAGCYTQPSGDSFRVAGRWGGSQHDVEH